MPSAYSPLPTPWKTSDERLRTFMFANSAFTFFQPASPPPHRSTSMVTVVYAEPELAGSVKAILPLYFGFRRSSHVLGPSLAGSTLVFCVITSTCRLLPIHRLLGS